MRDSMRDSMRMHAMHTSMRAMHTSMRDVRHIGPAHLSVNSLVLMIFPAKYLLYRGGRS